MVHLQLIAAGNDVLHLEVDIIPADAVCRHILIGVQNEDDFPLAAACINMEQFYRTVVRKVGKACIDDVIRTERKMQHRLLSYKIVITRWRN